MTADPIDLRLARQLRRIRKERCLTLRAVAETAHLSLQQIGKFERGESAISSALLCKLAVALDVDVTRFFEGLGEVSAFPAVPRREVPDAEIERAIARIGDTAIRTAVEDLIRCLRKYGY